LYVAPFVKRLCPETVRIVNTENVEHQLLSQVSERETDREKQQKALKRSYKQMLWYESHLARFVHAFFACSDNDRELLTSLNRGELEGFVVPNGVDTGTRPFDDSPEKSRSRELLFCGSLAHPPNREGLLWFHEEVWPRLVLHRPDLRLVVIGRGAETGDLGKLRCDPTVQLVGEVADVVPHYRRAGIAVVPLWMGSGTRLKILEAMSLGNPIVSTTLGAQGLGAADGEHLLLADDPVQFANAIEYLLSDEKGFERTRRHALAFAQEHDWHLIGQTMNRAIEAVLVTKQRGE
jgi:glycosyltransferase involved in cell wall biosynthesis